MHDVFADISEGPGHADVEGVVVNHLHIKLEQLFICLRYCCTNLC